MTDYREQELRCCWTCEHYRPLGAELLTCDMEQGKSLVVASTDTALSIVAPVDICDHYKHWAQEADQWSRVDAGVI